MDDKIARVFAACLARSNMGCDRAQKEGVEILLRGAISGRVHMSLQTVTNMVCADAIEPGTEEMFYDETKMWFEIMQGIDIDLAIEQYDVLKFYAQDWWDKVNPTIDESAKPVSGIVQANSSEFPKSEDRVFQARDL